MRNRGWWRYALALVPALGASALVLWHHPWAEALDQRWLALAAPKPVSAAAREVAIIELDGPAPRVQFIEVLNALRAQRPAAVGVLLDLGAAWPAANPKLWDALEDTIKGVRFGRRTPRSWRRWKRKLLALAHQGRKAEAIDARLALAMRHTRGLYLAMRTAPGEGDSPTYAFKPRLLHARRASSAPLHLVDVPLEMFVEQASGVGVANTPSPNEVAGGIARIVVPAGHRWVPSLALLLAAKRTVGHTQAVRVESGAVRFGRMRVPVDEQGRARMLFASTSEQAFPHYAAARVIQGGLRWHELAGKVVLIAPRQARAYVSPVGVLSQAEWIAQQIAAFVDGRVLRLPARGPLWAAGAALFAALVAALVCWRGPWLLAVITTPLAWLVLFIAAFWTLNAERAWLPWGAPLLGAAASMALALVLRWVQEVRAKAQAQYVHLGCELALVHRERGNLDQAFALLKALPPEEQVLARMRELAVEFEKKRRFHQAAEAFGWILAHRPDDAEAARRKAKAEELERAAMLATTSGAPVLVEGMETKPTIGRYEVERLLGRGAMGEVYLGRDPMIGRVVAIKTLPLAREFEEEELEEARACFFREAAAAGKLNHPNIVAIFDAGEDHDLAYIAMEYIAGGSLQPYTKPDRLLPIEKVLGFMAEAAQALDYAHRHGVIHRDVKPANLMLAKDGDEERIKITDFGIARVTSQTRTKTGTILGTPSYMSPEQAKGERVDGRSDVFSLGVTLFVLLTGTRPFTGDSLGALSYRIVHEPHPDILALRPELPRKIKEIVDRAMQKDPDARYASAAEMAADLKAVLEGLQASRKPRKKKS